MEKNSIHELEIANNFYTRFKGWMGRNLQPGSALLISPCSSVHTCFMRQSIDVLFIDHNGVVIRVIEDMRPWRFSPLIRGAAGVIELPSGQAAAAGLAEGELLPDSIRGMVKNYLR